MDEKLNTLEEEDQEKVAGGSLVPYGPMKYTIGEPVRIKSTGETGTIDTYVAIPGEYQYFVKIDGGTQLKQIIESDLEKAAEKNMVF